MCIVPHPLFVKLPGIKMTKSYQFEGNAVREATRSKLIELRQARIARREGRALNAPSSARDALDEAPQGLQASKAADELAAQIRSSLPQDITPEPDAQSAPAPSSDPVSAPTGDAAGSHLASAQTTLTQSDLSDLPGIGPGLIYLLQCNGVTRLADLAEREVAQLRQQLGFVGSLVNLEAWIAYAQGRATSA